LYEEDSRAVSEVKFGGNKETTNRTKPKFHFKLYLVFSLTSLSDIIP